MLELHEENILPYWEVLDCLLAHTQQGRTADSPALGRTGARDETFFFLILHRVIHVNVPALMHVYEG